MSEAGPVPESDATRPGRFRWQALFENTADPLFVLDRRRRIVFVNRAWEELAGLAAARAVGLVCRRPRPVAATDPLEEVLAHALTPPPEATEGKVGRARRFLPGPVWWDVEFFPLRQAGSQAGHFLIGRIRLVPAQAPSAAVPLPEKLVALRERRIEGQGLGLLSSLRPAPRRVAEQVRLAAGLFSPVLFVGEKGSGKRTLARILHNLGPRRDQGLAILECAHLPPAALEAVLFGTRPATSSLSAVYLAEPAALPRDLQLRLCELLAQRGAEGEKTAGPRFLAGCSVDPRAEVAAGRLLEELHCALAVLTIPVPSLRERVDDLPTLAARMLERLNTEGEPRITGFAPEAWDLLRGHAWPGNLAELFAVLSAARRHARTERIEAADLPASLRLSRRLAEEALPQPERVVPLDQVLENAERRLLELALRRARGNKTRAAELLAIWRPRLIRRMEALGIADAEESK